MRKKKTSTKKNMALLHFYGWHIHAHAGLSWITAITYNTCYAMSTLHGWTNPPSWHNLLSLLQVGRSRLQVTQNLNDSHASVQHSIQIHVEQINFHCFLHPHCHLPLKRPLAYKQALPNPTPGYGFIYL